LHRPRGRGGVMTVHVAGRDVAISPRSVAQLFLDEVRGTPRALKAWYGFLLGLMAVGAVGALFTIIPGAETFGTTPSFEWGLLIAAYAFFAITTSGLCLGSSLGTVFGIDMFRPLEKRHAILAVLTLTTAFGVIALDLHYPVRLVFGAVFNPSLGSPMWWMGVFYGVYLVFLLVEVWSMFFNHHAIHRYACLASSCTAVLAPSTLGAVFGVLANRSYWFGLFTPVAMLATALLSGSALLGIVFMIVVRKRLAGYERARRLGIPAIRALLLVALAAGIVLILRGLIVGWLSDDPLLRDAVAAQLTGPLAIPFWTRTIVGLAVPLVLLLLPQGRTATGVGAAALLIFAGVLVDRMTFVSAGQIIPATTVGGVVSDPYVEYTPSPVEIAIVLGALGFFGFMYTLAERYLDMSEPDAHVAFHLPRIVWTTWHRLTTRRPAAEVAMAASATAMQPSDALVPASSGAAPVLGGGDGVAESGTDDEAGGQA
ncbi:MAG TPA: NrfD/PsrC family molybdoenzyme membrane anchor subunit, partial [Candidatus Limnocylindrales bacterium]|nr:NrfD/PsrC family molybdoenzyme membrane anchor subunit [Candidatus Limnocylindrales bacterium]